MQTNTNNVKASRLELLIVISLQKLNAINPIRAVTLNELKSYCPTQQSYSTFYRAAKNLYQNGYIFLGAKDGKNDTYYLNEKGTNLIKECC